ncbi:MAG: hypothetical protein CR975_06665 [Gammaproteobacteria bacterium]|nr:MAG: hypothetical protein CR975_06665 [Gammaproteobacteria bacterium]
MRKILFSSLVMSALSTGCSEEKPPQVCYDALDITASVVNNDTSGEFQSGGQVVFDPDESRKSMEQKWEKMSDEKRERTIKACEMTKEIFSKLKNKKK